MNSANHESPTSDEKMMGALAHMFGPLAAIIVWAIQKDKSRFVKFQALQALAFDGVATITMGIFFFCIFSVIILGMFGAVFTILNDPLSSDGFTPFFFLSFMFPFMIFGCALPFSLGLLIVRLVASIAILNGRNYRYPILGKWLDTFLDS